MDIKAYTGSSFTNLSHGESQGIQIIFIGNEERQRRLIQWNSSKIKYVKRPILAKETISDSYDT